jgi:N-acetylneuraminic acid mutarotase
MPTARGSMHGDVIDGRFVVVGGEDPRSPLPVVEAYDIRSDRWATFPSLDVPRHGAAVAAAGGRLYAIGGAEGIGHTRSSRAVSVLQPPPRQRQPTMWRSGESAPAPLQQAAVARVNGVLWVVGGLDENNRPTARVEGLDPPFGFWREIEDDLPEAVHHAMAVNLDGRLVVLGGFVERDGVNVASDAVYEWRDDGWEPLPSMRTARAAGLAGVVDGRIVVVGGQDGRELVTQTEIYDPQAQTWSAGADIRTPREHLAGDVHEGFLYAAGGRDMRPASNVAAFERYDLANDRWEELPPMPTARGSIGGAVVQGQLAVVGGETPTEVLDTVELYDFAAGSWSTGPRMSTPRHGASVGQRGAGLYVMGGADRTLHRGSLASVEVLRFR